MNTHEHLDMHGLATLYRDWVNNFLTIDSFADYYNCTIARANELIGLGKIAHEGGY